MMIEKGYYTKELVYSSHITAGDFLEKPGDGLGFDACGKGRRYAEMLNPFGITGSHGGWAHNWFAEKLKKGELSREEIKRYVKINNECLERITGYKIREYSAPQGVHPQPLMTQILEELDMVAYYYTGDTGSFPNRTFFDGKMVSKKVIAFPITPLEDVASLYEMWAKGFSKEKVGKWLKDMVDFVVERKTIRLIYSHPYDIPHYPEEIKGLIDYAIQKSREGLLNVKPMVYFYDYLERFLKTRFSFSLEEGRFRAELSNGKSLKGIPIAVPKKYCQEPQQEVSFQDEKYLYFVIKENVKKFVLTCGYSPLSQYPLKVWSYYKKIEEENYFNPYIGNIIATYLLLKEGKEKLVKGYLKWYLTATDEKGVMQDYLIDRNFFQEKTGKYDSIDGYTGSFLVLFSLYVLESGDWDFFWKTEANYSRWLTTPYS